MMPAGIAEFIVCWRLMGWTGFCVGGWEYWTDPDLAGIGGGVRTMTDWVLFEASDESCGAFTFGGSLEGGEVGFRAGIDGNFCWVEGCTASAFTGTGWPTCFNGTWIGFGWVGGDWLGLLIIVCNLLVGCCGKCCVVCWTLCCNWGDGAVCICFCCMCGDFLLSDPAAT